MTRATKRGAHRARLSRTAVAALVATALAVTGAGVGAATLTATAAPAGCAVTPTGDYPRADPATQGFDPQRLQAALAYAQAQGTQSLHVFRRGCEVGTDPANAAFDRVPANNYGQTKAVVALATGVAEREGLVDVHAPIDRYLPPGLGDAAHRAVTVEQLLQLTSGIQTNHVRGLNLFLDQSRAREYFSAKLTHAPGTYYEFDETTPSVLVYVLQQTIAAREPGLDFQDWLQRELFDPLGIPRSAYFWQRDQAGTSDGATQLWLRPLEFGRLGALMLGDGSFAGRRLITPGFADALHRGSSANCGFGYMVWLNGCRPGQTQVNTDYPSRRTYPGEAWISSAPSDLYFTMGLGDSTYVIPSLDMVVTRSGEPGLDTVPGAARANLHDVFPGNAGGPGEHEFFRLLMAAVTDMPASVRSSIANSGPYDRAPNDDLYTRPFVDPPTSALGSYGGVGPDAGQGCRPRPAGCDGEPNDGYQRELGDAPRTVPGVVGAEQRPTG